MLDVLADIDQWLEAGHSPIGLATVVETWGSAPRRVGAKMAFTDGGLISGSVSGGCVEGAVLDVGQTVLQTAVPQLAEYGVADDTAWDVGLACGGRITVFVEPLDLAAYRFARDLIQAGESGVIATIIGGQADLLGSKLLWTSDTPQQSHLPLALDSEIMQLIAPLSASRRLQLTNDVDLFADVLRPPPSLVIIGGAHVAVALARLAKTVGYRTIVIDPRRAFGNIERFPDVDRLIQEWPLKALANVALTQGSAVVTLSHDPKIDDPALQVALNSEAFYVGALGSRQTHAERCERLAQRGTSAGQLARIHAPIGMDIAADTPEEIALAIMAEVVGAHRRRSD